MTTIPSTFIREPTTSHEWSCWTLYADSAKTKILGSITTDSGCGLEEAWAKFKSKKRWEAGFWAAVESGDPEALKRVLDG